MNKAQFILATQQATSFEIKGLPDKVHLGLIGGLSIQRTMDWLTGLQKEDYDAESIMFYRY